MRETRTRTILNHREEGHFCPCGEPAANSCTDAIQQGTENWLESAERFGCRAHPVEPIIYFADGTNMTAKEFRRVQ